jgi:hypothetical protein
LLDSPQAVLEGGESGPPVVPGEAERSLLIHALRHQDDLEMPPDEPLPQTVIDELLASPHFGERWGRRWLDVARFAESNGNDGLSRNATFPHAWRYRDYVIDALNRDVPYDRFLTEQIAGDLLAKGADSDEERHRLLTATGFLAIDPKQSGRLQLAEWLTMDHHPQTARVLANRIWLHLFGQGIGGTPDDFGVYGNRRQGR